MPRHPRIVLPGEPHHVTQRGNFRQEVFFIDSDYRLYLDLLRVSACHYGTAILAYCLMPNHVHHLIVVPHSAEALSLTLQTVQSDHSRATNLRLRRRGHLWQARYYSVALDENHLWNAMVYVEQNPARANLAKTPWDWRYSSARAHVANHDDGVLDLSRWRAAHTAETWRPCLSLGLHDAALLERIREATITGHPLGSDDFLNRVEAEFQLNARPATQEGPESRSPQRDPKGS